MKNTSSNARNPYDFGCPIKKKAYLFGRDSILSEIDMCLNRGERVVFLYGQRRIGKTSILHQIPAFIKPGKFKFVNFDCQSFSTVEEPGSLISNLLYSLASQIVQDVGANESLISDFKEFANYRNSFDLVNWFKNFLINLKQDLENKELVILLDEIDVLNNSDPNSRFFSFINTIISESDTIHIVGTIGRHVDKFKMRSKYFDNSHYIQVSFLREEEARKILNLNQINPEINLPTYSQDAASYVLKLTANHPYLVQVFCSKIFDYASENYSYQISIEEVEENIEEVIRESKFGLLPFWEQTEIEEKLMMLALIPDNLDTPYILEDKFIDPITVLQNCKLIITEELKKVLEKLEHDDFIERQKCPPQNLDSKTCYRIKIPLVSIWLKHNYRLNDVIRKYVNSLGTVSENVEDKITDERISDTNQESTTYRNAIDIRPNDISTILRLAEIHHNNNEYEESIQLYERAATLDNDHTHHLIRVQVSHFSYLAADPQKYDEAKQVFQSISYQFNDDPIIQAFVRSTLKLNSHIERKIQESREVNELVDISAKEDRFLFFRERLTRISTRYLNVPTILITILISISLVPVSFLVWKEIKDNEIKRSEATYESAIEQEDPLKAINLLKNIPPGSPSYNYARKKMNYFSEKILSEATSLSNSDVNVQAWETVWMLNQIPEGTSAYQDARKKIDEYSAARKSKKVR